MLSVTCYENDTCMCNTTAFILNLKNACDLLILQNSHKEISKFKVHLCITRLPTIMSSTVISILYCGLNEEWPCYINTQCLTGLVDTGVVSCRHHNYATKKDYWSSGISYSWWRDGGMQSILHCSKSAGQEA